MKRTFRAALVAAALFLLALVVPSNEARAAEELNVQDWLSRPGVRLVAVEFYATWCKPCMEAMPRWKKLKEKYGSQGLRIIVVNTQDPDGACRALPFVPDETVCDLEGNVADAFKLQGKLPSAYLWSWQGNLLVAKGHIDEIEKAIEGYLKDAPRVIVEAGDGVGPEVVAAMRDRLTEDGKVLVLAGKAEQAALDAAKRASQGARYDEKLACEIGKEIPPNALLKVSRVTQGKASYLNLALLDLAGGCLLSSASSEWGADLRRVTQDASSKLLAKLRRPGGLQSAVAGAARHSAREQAQGPSLGPPSFGSDDDVLVSFESTPAGVKVEVDGAAVCDATPCKRMVKPGKRMVSMGGPCVTPKDDRVAVKGDKQTVSWSLDSEKAGLRVELSDSTGAPVEGTVSLDGVAVGATWKTLPVSACGKQLEVAARDATVRQAVTFKAGEVTKVQAKLPGGGGMAVIPSGAVVVEAGIGRKNVATFSIDVTEVTVDQYAKCVGAGGCTEIGLNLRDENGESRPGAKHCNWGKSDRGNHPINCVDWHQADAFCKWAGKRLPSEEEWQLAAESGEGRIYPWGSSTPSNQLCWEGEGNPEGKGNRESTCVVGSFPEGNSAQGVKDLSGNVLEWTDSCARADCGARVLRGGAWIDSRPVFVRAAQRSGRDQSYRVHALGFRCAR